MPSRQRGLPPRAQDRSFLRSLDDMTDPGPRPADEALGTSVGSGTSVSQDTPRTASASAAADRGRSVDAPAARQHVKLRADLADQMRDAVWFFSEHGRPRVQLGELLDEAIAAWLEQSKRAHNGGDDFPHKGRLR